MQRAFRCESGKEVLYEVTVLQLQVDEVGLGSGSMAAAARVKPGGETGVQIDDYADEPIKLVTVSRKIP